LIFNYRYRLTVRVATDSAGASSRDDIEYAQFSSQDESEQPSDQHGTIASEMREVEELTHQT
jgi:hypothetical protein